MVLIELRNIVRRDLLTEILPVLPQEIDEDALSAIARKSFKQLITKELINMCFYMLGVILCVMAPVQIGHYIFPSLTPLTLRFNDVLFEVQLPLEMVVFHVLVPFALDHLRFRSLIHSALDRFLSWACVLLDVTYILENPPVREPTGGGNVHAPILGRVMEQENEEYFQNATES